MNAIALAPCREASSPLAAPGAHGTASPFPPSVIILSASERRPPVSTTSRAVGTATWRGPAFARHIGQLVEVLDTHVNQRYYVTGSVRPVCVRLPGGTVVVAHDACLGRLSPERTTQ